MQARYVILRVLMDCDSPVVNIERITGSDGKPDLLIRFDRSKLETIGKPAIGEFLKKLQVNNNCMFCTIIHFADGASLLRYCSNFNYNDVRMYICVHSHHPPHILPSHSISQS